MHQYWPWQCHLPVQRGLDWRREGLCGHRQLHAGEQRELSHQCWLHLYRPWSGMGYAKQTDGWCMFPKLLCEIAEGRNWAGHQQSLIVCCQKHQLLLGPHRVLVWWGDTGMFEAATLLWHCCAAKGRNYNFITRHWLLCQTCSQISALSLGSAKTAQRQC